MLEITPEMPEWEDLTARQQQILEKNYPLHRFICFSLPIIRLIYTEEKQLAVLLLVIKLFIYYFSTSHYLVSLCLSIIFLIIRIEITVKNRNICYSGKRKEMLNILLEYRNKRDDTLPDYDNGKITNNVNILRWILSFISIIYGVYTITKIFTF